PLCCGGRACECGRDVITRDRASLASRALLKRTNGHAAVRFLRHPGSTPQHDAVRRTRRRDDPLSEELLPMSNITALEVGLPPPLIRVEAVAKSFALPDRRRFDAVKSVSLQVREGDVFGLIGKSGAGKSTLLRLINLLERPDAGRVFVAGRE